MSKAEAILRMLSINNPSTSITPIAKKEKKKNEPRAKSNSKESKKKVDQKVTQGKASGETFENFFV